MIKLAIRIASAMLLALSLVFSITACSGEDEADTPAESVSQEAGESEADDPAEGEDEDEADEADDLAAQEEALDAYVKNIQENSPKLEGDQYSDQRVVAEHPGTVVFEYVLADDVDIDAVKKTLDDQKETYQDLADMVFPEMERNGITESQEVVYTFYDKDEEEIWSESFVPSDPEDSDSEDSDSEDSDSDVSDE